MTQQATIDLETFVDWLLDKGLTTVVGLANDHSSTVSQDPVQAFLNATSDASAQVNLTFHSIDSHGSSRTAPRWCRELWSQYANLPDSSELTAHEVLRMLAQTPSWKSSFPAA